MDSAQNVFCAQLMQDVTYQYIDIVLQYPQFHGIDFPTKETSFLITSMINLIE